MKEISLIKQWMTDIKGEIDSGFKWLDVKEMSIDELYELLALNVEIKKKLRLLLSDIDVLSKKIMETWKWYLSKKAKSTP